MWLIIHTDMGTIYWKMMLGAVDKKDNITLSSPFLFHSRKWNNFQPLSFSARSEKVTLHTNVHIHRNLTLHPTVESKAHKITHSTTGFPVMEITDSCDKPDL
jgi:hypothetical protein